MSSAPEGFTNEQWHRDAIADTGASYTTHPRQYVVRCAWCPEIFFGPSKDAAMRQFRIHEREMLGGAS